MKLSAVLKGYWLDKELEFSPNTVKQYRYAFNHLIDFLGDAEFERITSDDIRRYLMWLRTEREVGKRTQQNYWITLSSLWTWAETELGVPHIIRGKVAKPTFTKKVIEPLTVDEVRRLLEVAAFTDEWMTATGKTTRSKRPTAERDKAIILMLLDTGIRASELCDLTIGDYDEKLGRFHIRHGKNDKARFVVAGKRTQRAIWRYLLRRPKAKQGDPLFATRDGVMDRTNLYHTIKRLGDRAGITDAHPHKFRHTYAINFLRNGGNVKTLQEILGHESMDMVMNYVHLAEQDIDAAQRHSPADNWRL